MNRFDSIPAQLRRNFVALISLVVAITSLGYNTWRNEASEYNRNQRLISIEVLRNLSDLQEVVFYIAWEKDREVRGNPRTGWVHVLSVRDLSQLLDGDVSTSAQQLLDTWETSWRELAPGTSNYDELIAALEAVRQDTHDLISDLD